MGVKWYELNDRQWLTIASLLLGKLAIPAGPTRIIACLSTVAIEKEVRCIAEDGPMQKGFDEAKSYLKGSQMLALDTSSRLAQALLQYQRRTSCRLTMLKAQRHLRPQGPRSRD